MRNLVHNNGYYEMSESKYNTLMAHGALRRTEEPDVYRLADVAQMKDDPGSIANAEDPAGVLLVLADALLTISED